jgi:hypothetical protein
LLIEKLLVMSFSIDHDAIRGHGRTRLTA